MTDNFTSAYIANTNGEDRRWLCKLVEADIQPYLAASDAERVEIAAKILQKVRSWQKTAKLNSGAWPGSKQESSILDQAYYAQQKVKNGLRVSVKLHKKLEAWEVFIPECANRKFVR
ncbi:hypothetical protein [Azotobacter beijerinckii]|uniref:hypothetical protein n=1 Tax=Azotobacter beijerinckii TaxID=170623 RepID=UPI0011132DE3|nr:hypothetical protein [Azotobacter beijerinckii]